MLLVGFWQFCLALLLSVYTQNHYSLIRWSLPRFSLLSFHRSMLQAYAGSFPVTSDESICFGTSRLSIKTTCSTHSVKVLAVLQESCCDYWPQT